ncbi:MAG TPA: hypothetical protein VHO01_16420 [Jatrophihabitans sp.]|nr:hypothetical protein [Jatrophihabitans sp.]
MKIEVTACNVCRDPGRQTTEFTIAEAGAGRGVKVDLCDEHSTHVRELIAGARNGETRSRVAAPRQRAAAKAPGKKAPAKKAAARKAPVTSDGSSDGRRQGATPIMTLAEIEAAKAAARQ